MTIETALPWLKEHNQGLTERIRRGKSPPSLVGWDGNPKAGRRNTETQHPDRHRPNHPTSNAPAAHANL